MNATGTVVHASGSSTLPSEPLPCALITHMMGLSESEAQSVLANPKHGAMLEALFHPTEGSFKMVHAPRKDPSREVQFSGFVADPNKPLPSEFASLVSAIAHVNPRLAGMMTIAPLLCEDRPICQAGLAITCSNVWKEAGLPEPGMVLGKAENATLQKQMLELLADDENSLELKLLWAPLVNGESGVPPMPSHENGGMPEGSVTHGGEEEVQMLKGHFFAALIHGDDIGMDFTMQLLRAVDSPQAKQAFEFCQQERSYAVKDALVPQIRKEEVAPPTSPLTDGPPSTPPDHEHPTKVVPRESPSPLDELLDLFPSSPATLSLLELNRSGPGLLYLAIVSEDFHQMEHLLQGPGAFLINAKCTSDGLTALGCAASMGKMEVVDFLLKCPGLDVNQCCLLEAREGEAALVARKGGVSDACPLLLAAKGGHTEVIKALLNHPGTDVNATNRHGQTPLCQAVRSGHAQLVEMLLEDPRVDATLADQFGFTPLHVAAANTQHPELVGLFIDQLERVQLRKLANLVDTRGNKPLDLAEAVQSSHPLVVAPLLRLTEVSQVKNLPPSILTDYSQSLMLVGPDVPGFPLDSYHEVAGKAGVSLTLQGDGARHLIWGDLEKLQVQQGTCAIVSCHGSWNEQRQMHTMQLGGATEVMVPTEDIVHLLYEKGVRKMTFFGCQIGRGVDGICQSMNTSMGWLRPLDPELEITFVGGKLNTLISTSIDDARCRIADLGEELKGEDGGSMERLTVSSREILTWNGDQGKVVMMHHGPPKAGDRGDLTPEQDRVVQGNLLMKRIDRGRNEKVASLLAEGRVDVNYTDSFDYFPLRTAASKGRLEIAQMLLEQDGIEINKASASGITALLTAIERGHKDVVEVLLNHPDIDVNQAEQNGGTPLSLAASWGQLELVKMLFQHKGLVVDRDPPGGSTILDIAVSEGHVDVVAFLFKEAGFDVNRQAGDGFIPLGRAAGLGKLEVVKALLTAPGIDVHKVDSQGNSALVYACIDGHCEVVKELLKLPGIDLNARVGSGLPVVLEAAVEGHTEVVRMLVDQGANLSDVDERMVKSFVDRGLVEIAEILSNGRNSAVPKTEEP